MTQLPPISVDSQTGDGDAQGSRLTLRDMLRSAALLGGCPDPATEQAITTAQVLADYPEEHIVWILQEWIRGRLEAYDPFTLRPVLSPRNHRSVRVSWDYVAGVIPGPGACGSIGVGKLPARLPLYGTFKFYPDGEWRFGLHPQDRPIFRRIDRARSVTFSIPIVVKGGLAGVEEVSSLFLRIARENNLGLVVSAEHGGLPIYGVSAALHDLAQDCLRAQVFNRESLNPAERVLWGNAIAWFFATIFARQLPTGLADAAEVGSPENQVVHQARAAIVARLAAMIFDRTRVAEAVAKFQAAPIPLYPEDVVSPAVQTEVPVRNPTVPAQTDVDPATDDEKDGASAEEKEASADIYALMAKRLPDLLPRSTLPKMCEELLGTQLIGKSTLEKLDMRKAGPPSVEIRGRVHYPRDAFIQWFREWNAAKASGLAVPRE